jgi:hypothetical protein
MAAFWVIYSTLTVAKVQETLQTFMESFISKYIYIWIQVSNIFILSYKWCGQLLRFHTWLEVKAESKFMLTICDQYNREARSFPSLQSMGCRSMCFPWRLTEMGAWPRKHNWSCPISTWPGHITLLVTHNTQTLTMLALSQQELTLTCTWPRYKQSQKTLAEYQSPFTAKDPRSPITGFSAKTPYIWSKLYFRTALVESPNLPSSMQKPIVTQGYWPPEMWLLWLKG